jgi:RHS repeat-associated protein
MNQRIRKTVDNIVTQSFFNEDWQELESREPGTASPVTVYVWGARYIDDLLYRQRGEEKLYSLADANWNVVALTNTSGNVVERMKYDAFGKITWLDSNFGTKTNSGFDWNRTFTGQVLDTETGLMLYRNRYYHTGLGRFVSRDPIKYDAGDVNIYRYVENSSTNRVDFSGLQNTTIGPITSKSTVRCPEPCGELHTVITKTWLVYGPWRWESIRVPPSRREVRNVTKTTITTGGCGGTTFESSVSVIVRTTIEPRDRGGRIIWRF